MEHVFVSTASYTLAQCLIAMGDFSESGSLLRDNLATLNGQSPRNEFLIIKSR